MGQINKLWGLKIPMVLYSMLKILFFGDITGRPGRQALAKILPDLKKEYQPDLILANGENLAHGIGVTERSLNQVLEAGVDLLTSGNHIWDKKEGASLLGNKKISLLRPANYPPTASGRGWEIVKVRTKKILVINLMGRVFFREDLDCPFRKADEILKETEKKNLAGIIVDFHGEATSEKKAMGYYLDGRVSAVLGTHTHIPTADNQILPKGTAHISDIGMVGAKDSVLGMESEGVIKHFLEQTPFKLEIADKGEMEVDAVMVEIDSKGKATKIEQIRRFV